jgi:hypothetical protein
VNSISGGMALSEGAYEEARSRVLAAAESFNAIGDQIALQMMFRALATTAARLGEPERAARLHGFAARLVADTGGIRFTPPFEAEDALEIVRGMIGTERADQEWQKGQQMSRDEAMALARMIGMTEGAA